VLDRQQDRLHGTTWTEFRRRATHLRVSVTGAPGSGIESALVLLSASVTCRGSHAADKWLLSLHVTASGADAIMSGRYETVPLALARIPLPTLTFLSDCNADSIGIRVLSRVRISSEPVFRFMGDVPLKPSPIKALKQDSRILSVARTAMPYRDLMTFMASASFRAKAISRVIADHLYFDRTRTVDSCECYAGQGGGIIGIKFTKAATTLVVNVMPASAIFCTEYQEFIGETRGTLIKQAKKNAATIRRLADNVPSTLRPTILELSQNGQHFILQSFAANDIREGEVWAARLLGARLASTCFKDKEVRRCLEHNGFPAAELSENGFAAHISAKMKYLQLFEAVGAAQLALSPSSDEVTPKPH